MADLKFVLLGAALFLVVACASRPTVFLSVHGPYKNQLALIAEIVERTGATARATQIDPPAGATGPVVIHGDSRLAESTAKRIAYDIYTELGDWVAVRRVSVTNHSYSKYYVGLYLLDEETAKQSEQDVRNTVVVKPSHEYMPTQCESFEGVLRLHGNGRFQLTGTQFAESGSQADVALGGTYTRNEGTLDLRNDGRVYTYREEPIQWPADPVARTRLVRLDKEAPSNHAFRCDFIQDLQVVPKSASGGSTPAHIGRLFEHIAIERPEDLMSREGQQHMQGLSAAGREDLHSSVADWAIMAKPCAPLQDTKVSAVAEIVRQASLTRVVIINEAHDRPRHREFVRQVAVALSAVGYNHFAAETFGPEIRESGKLAYPRLGDGVYSDEPVFGHLVRDAKSLGFELRHYESEGADDQEKNLRQRITDREEAQADNLARILNELGDTDRLLIHVGYSHASEVPIWVSGEPLAWMASRLKRKTGIDPLTIDQTDCLSGSDEPSLTMPGRHHEAGQFDLVVGHPAPAFQQGRPVYRLNLDARLVQIPGELLSDTNRVIVEARFADEPDEAVPIDRLMLWPGEVLPLVLPDGELRLTSYTEGSSRAVSVSIAVGDGPE